ncbi:hypothetical protein P280DRAFT_458889 [Massarina eburnea CBS 473.64]|uniref:DUF7905 domain-containing protein n=1 Tax=Massarina eburnea CBS 473.64 TaxID=1395130 RepID=A0A6A6RP57_9PLEO|nr:hypothetical protein P280DRAFT_458889 [Massarina eburnea CBS 473.64]
MSDNHNFPPRTAQSGRKPSQVIIVPPEYRRDTTSAERERLIYTLKQYGVELVPNWDVGSANGQGPITRFLMFGTGSGLEKATVEINKWILSAKTKSKESTAWAKTPAYDVNKWWYEQVWEKEAARKEMFKGLPEDENDENLFSLIVEWPKELCEEDSKTLPKDVFGGPKLEGLDPLRFEHEVFIIPLMQKNWPVEIKGYKEENVDAAAAHYQSLMLKIQIQNASSARPINIILDECEGIDVCLEEAEKWWPNREHIIAPRLIHSPMMYEPGAFRKDGLHSTTASAIQHALKLGLEAIRYQKGYYDFSIRFGAFVLHTSNRMPVSLIGKSYPKDVFLAGVNTSFECEAKKWQVLSSRSVICPNFYRLMNDSNGKALLARLIASDDFLEPMKSAGFFGYTPPSLDDVRPMFRGTWIFRDPNAPRWPKDNKANKKDPPSLMVVQIDWTDDEEGMYEKMEPRFFQLKPGHSSPEEHLDIKMLELGESRAWQLSIESMSPIPKRLASPALRGFADGVTIKPNYQLQSNGIFAMWKNSSSLPLLNGRLDKVYSFGIQKTCYRVELIGMWYPGQAVPCWGINFRHGEWATHLAQLERLVVGRGAEWGDAIATFLPNDGLSSFDTAPKDETDLRRLQKFSLNMNNPETPRDGTRLVLDQLMRLSAVINRKA